MIKHKRDTFSNEQPKPVIIPEPSPVQTIEKTEWTFKGNGYVNNPYGNMIHFDPSRDHIYKTKDKRVADHLRKCKVREL